MRFPDAPVTPEVFFTRWLPGAFAARAGESIERASEHSARVKLEGEGGGEWVLRVRDGALEVRAGDRAETALSVLQSVEDWRGALWEGRGFARAAPVLPASTGPLASAALFQPATLAEFARLDGLLRFTVTGGRGGDWRLDLRLGPGAVPAEPDCEVSVASADAARLAAGALDPFEFLFGGSVLIRGDLTLLLQLQAIQMEATSGRAAWGGSSTG